MEGYTYLAIIVLAGILVASLQLPLGTLLLLYHSSLSRHIPKKTKRLASSYISGVALMHFLILSATTLLIGFLSLYGILSKTFLTIIFGVLIALAFIAWFFYYKKGTTTELWLPKQLTHYLAARAKSASSETEAYSLGLLTPLAEILFTLVLFVLAGDAVLHLPSGFAALGLVIFTAFSVLPLCVLRAVLRSGRNVAEVQRWRLRHKTFFRIFAGCGFAVLASFLLAFVILGDAI